MVQRHFLVSVLVCLCIFLPVHVSASDENMDTSVYLTFDPATGQFVSATKNISKSKQFVDTGIQPDHQATNQSPAEISSTIDEANPVVLNTTATTGLIAGQSTNQFPNTSIFIYGLLALTGFGIVGLLIRKRNS